MTTPNTGIPYVPENTLDPAAGLNLALNVIDALLQTAVIDVGVNTPPGSPADGDLYIVGTGTGAWTGHDDALARYVAQGDFWQFYAAGSRVHLVLNKADGGLYAWDGAVWALAAGLGDAPSDGTGYVRKDGAWEPESGGGGGGGAVWGGISGTLADQTDLQSALDAKIGRTLSIVTEGSAFTATPATHAGSDRLIRAGGNVTFNSAESYSAGQVYSIRATGAITLVGTGVTLTPPAGGTLNLSAAMAVTVVMTSGTAGDVIGQTVAA